MPSKKVIPLIPVPVDAESDPVLVARVDNIINTGLAEIESMIRDGSADVKVAAIKSIIPLINRKLDPKRDEESEEMAAMKVAFAELTDELRK